MSQRISPDLNGVPETLLITLYLRAMESQRPDALIKDEQAVELVRRLDYDFGQIGSLHLDELNKLVIILRNRRFDRHAQDFMARHPDAVVVHIGCGLDTRFERVAQGHDRVEWYDLDFPEVIDLRRRLIGAAGERHHLLGCSVLEQAWLDQVSAHRPRPFLFLAEGVFMYFEGAQVRQLVLRLRDHFPGAELVFDAFSPIHALRSNLQTAGFGLRIHWSIWRGQQVEKWGEGIHLLDEWGFFDDPTPRLNPIRWLRPVESLARTMRIYHFRLERRYVR